MKFDGNSTLVCPACDEIVCVGFGGEKNLAIHRTSKACKNKSQKKSKGSKSTKPNQDLHAFFKPHVPLNPPTVTAPAPVHADEIKARVKDRMSCETSNVTVSCNDLREMGTLSSRPSKRCYVTAGTFTRLGLCRLPYDKALVSRVLSISHDE
jgi:hypothetical protein